MAKKPFPFSVCEQCCSTGGSGGSSADLSDYVTKEEFYNNVIVISNAMTKEDIVETINNAPKGTVFDIQTSLDLYDVNISFPEESTVFSSTGKKAINFGYSDESINDGSSWENSWYLSFGKFSKIYDISVYFTDNATSNVGVSFGEGCTVTNCYFAGYAPFYWDTNCTFINCYLSYYIYGLSTGGSYINCTLDFTEEWGGGVDCSSANIINCTSFYFYISPDNGAELIARIKALNPGMNIVDADGNEIKGLYATSEDIGNIETALDSIIAIQNNLMGVSE